MTSLSPTYQPSALQDDSDFDPAKHLSVAEQKDLLQDSKSTLSDFSDTATKDDAYSIATTMVDNNAVAGFNVTKKLGVHAQGLRLVQLPMPSRQLELPIEDLSTGKIAYVSTRKRVHGSDAVLSAPGRGDLIQSLYKFGPGRNPKLVIVGTDEEVNVKGKWMKHEQIFSLNDDEKLRWKYVKEISPGSPAVRLDGKKAKPKNILCCEVGVKRVAMLLRDDETRTDGTKKRDAGNGGELWIDEQLLKLSGVTEELVVASCILMLKKEMDRRRAVQFAALSAMASGGS
jgi:hypothetical protein